MRRHLSAFTFRLMTVVFAVVLVAGLGVAAPQLAAASAPAGSASLPAGWSGPFATGLPSVNEQDSLFCLSSSSCMADSYYSSTVGGSQVAAYNGAGWSTTYTDTVYRCSGCTGPVMSAIQCLSASLCHALDNQGDFLTYDGTEWTSDYVNSDLYWGSLSCPTASFCIAGDAYGNVWSFNGTSWSGPTPIDSHGTVPGGDQVFPDSLIGISCPSTSFCAAVDASGYVMTYDGTSWSTPEEVAPSILGAVSCPTATFCAAGDSTGGIVMYNGSAWTVKNIDTTAIPALSCASPSFCLAGDNSGNVFSFNGSSWSSAAPLEAGNVISSISCPTASFCAAGDTSGNVFYYGATGSDDGTLRLSATLPPCLTTSMIKGSFPGTVTVTGPDGYQQNLGVTPASEGLPTWSDSLTLPAGTYRLSATSFTLTSGGTYTPTLADSAVTITAGQATEDAITYNAPMQLQSSWTGTTADNVTIVAAPLASSGLTSTFCVMVSVTDSKGHPVPGAGGDISIVAPPGNQVPGLTNADVPVTTDALGVVGLILPDVPAWIAPDGVADLVSVHFGSTLRQLAVSAGTGFEISAGSAGSALSPAPQAPQATATQDAGCMSSAALSATPTSFCQGVYAALGWSQVSQPAQTGKQLVCGAVQDAFTAVTCAGAALVPAGTIATCIAGTATTVLDGYICPAAAAAGYTDETQLTTDCLEMLATAVADAATQSIVPQAVADSTQVWTADNERALSYNFSLGLIDAVCGYLTLSGFGFDNSETIPAPAPGQTSEPLTLHLQSGGDPVADAAIWLQLSSTFSPGTGGTVYVNGYAEPITAGSAAVETVTDSAGNVYLTYDYPPATSVGADTIDAWTSNLTDNPASTAETTYTQDFYPPSDGSGCPDSGAATSDTIVCGVPSLVPDGQAMNLSAGGFSPGATVTWQLHSAVATLGKSTANSQGVAILRAAMPARTSGQHTIVATGEGANHQPAVATALVTATSRLPAHLAVQQMLGISCVAASSCVAVGAAGTITTTTTRPLAEHWNGTSWLTQPIPLPAGADGGTLQAVSCSSPTSCLAVGYYLSSATGTPKALAAQLTGRRWELTPLPQTGHANSVLTGVSCAKHTCLAVGYAPIAAGSRTIIAASWNGRLWRPAAALAPDDSTSASFTSASCTSSCVAVGSTDQRTGNHSTVEILAEEWTAHGWRVIDPASTKRSGAGATSTSVSCTSAAFCIETGTQPGSKAGTLAPAISRWTGTDWTTQTAAPVKRSMTATLLGISCSSQAFCLAVGAGTLISGTLGLAELWNGHRWAITSPLAPAGADDWALDAVSCVSATWCAAVGSSYQGGGTASFAERWNGKHWAVMNDARS